MILKELKVENLAYLSMVCTVSFKKIRGYIVTMQVPRLLSCCVKDMLFILEKSKE